MKYSDGNHAPHLDLLNLRSCHIDDVLAFAHGWGLLGTALRWELVDRGLYAPMAGTWAETVVYPGIPLENGEAQVSGRGYFKHCFKKPPEEVPSETACLKEVYGEWVDPGPHLTGDPAHDARELAVGYSAVAPSYATFTDGAEDFQRAYREIESGEASLLDQWGGAARAEISLSFAGRTPRLAFYYPSLLDACFIMTMMDVERDNLRRCPECRRFWRRETSDSRRTTRRIFCPLPDEPDVPKDSRAPDPEGRSCARRAHNRKADQRGSWGQFLEREAPHLIPGLPCAEANVQHPYDMRKEMPPDVWTLARQWAEGVARRSSRPYDMWLEPFLGTDS
ncbi:MAG: hypothetical protein Q8P50_06865 [Bacillota bacterium]|nr:hypothetical protein [Bacillota bacterium]